MSKTLIVMRHAKSSWDAPVNDIDRSLNARGHLAAAAVGDWLRGQNLHPDGVVSSSATRVQETGAGLKIDAPLTQIKALYMASADVLLNHVQRATGDTVLLIAHNPGIGEFADMLAHTAPNHQKFYDYPSGATTVFNCEIDTWDDLKFGVNTATHFVVPKDLV